MSKRLLIVVTLVLIALPLSAQSNPATLTIPDRLVADAQGRFTTLTAALKATGLDAILSGDAPYTLLAPTDAAFKTLSDFFGETTDELLADTATLKQILRYHILPGRVFFRQLAQGQSFPTALEGKTIQGKLANGFLVIGDVRASDVDVIAANGVIQVIGSVLLPADILPTAHLRVADFSLDTPGLDVYVDGGLTLFQAFGFPLVTGWMELPAAIHTIAFTTNGGSLDNPLIIPSDFTLRPNTWTTLAAVGSVAKGTLIPVLIFDDATPIPEGKARLTIVNAVEGSPPIDFLLNGAVVVSRLGFPFAFGDNDGYFSFDHAAGTYEIGAQNYGESTPLSANHPATTFEAGKRYLIAVVGSIDQPELIVSADAR